MKWILVSLAWWSLVACTEVRTAEPRLGSFRLSFHTEMVLGAESAPLPFVSGAPCAVPDDCEPGQHCSDGECAVRFVVDIEALRDDGQPYPFSGTIHLDVTPGRVAPSTEWLWLDAGRADGVTIDVRGVAGTAHLWAEDVGFEPRQPGQLYGQCNNGQDDDGDGLVDLGDSGCASADDDRERNPSAATGLSEALHFSHPSIRDVERTTYISVSPLEGEQVQVERGTMVVVNLVATGFYAVDLEAQPPAAQVATEDPTGGHNGLFIYTFGKPRGVDYGDVLCRFSGGVDEHVGMTQVVFPSFDAYEPDNPYCGDETTGLDLGAQPPDPAPLTAALFQELDSDGDPRPAICLNSRLLEGWESNIVSLQDIEVSTTFIACDRDNNGIVDDGAEALCQDLCQDDPLCTDLEGYFEFAQWAATTAKKKKVYFSAAQADAFQPLRIRFLGAADDNGLCTPQTTPEGFLAYQCPPRTLLEIAGSLKHVYLCGDNFTDAQDECECNLQFWVVEPRFSSDVSLDPELDLDKDGVSLKAGDCNDNSAQARPGLPETPSNGYDDDCDGKTDETP